jgi:two-component system chemotaxis response regulator CheY
MEQAVIIRKKVLAVDDSKSLRQMVSFTLRGAGFDVVEAENGQEALEISRKEAFNLVLTDQNMPRMDGLALVRSLRALPAYQKVPILVLTTESSDEMKQQGRAAGATGWIVKPFNPERLIEIVKKVTG